MQASGRSTGCVARAGTCVSTTRPWFAVSCRRPGAPQHAGCAYQQINAQQTTVPSAADTTVLSLRQKLAGEIEKRLDVDASASSASWGLNTPSGHQSRLSGAGQRPAGSPRQRDRVSGQRTGYRSERTLIPIVETALMDRMIEQTILRLGARFLRRPMPLR